METKAISEPVASQGVVVDDMAHFNDDVNKAACSTSRNSGGGDKGTNVSSITESRLAIYI